MVKNYQKPTKKSKLMAKDESVSAATRDELLRDHRTGDARAVSQRAAYLAGVATGGGFSAALAAARATSAEAPAPASLASTGTEGRLRVAGSTGGGEAAPAATPSGTNPGSEALMKFAVAGRRKFVDDLKAEATNNSAVASNPCHLYSDLSSPSESSARSGGDVGTGLFHAAPYGSASCAAGSGRGGVGGGGLQPEASSRAAAGSGRRPGVAPTGTQESLRVAGAAEAGEAAPTPAPTPSLANLGTSAALFEMGYEDQLQRQRNIVADLQNGSSGAMIPVYLYGDSPPPDATSSALHNIGSGSSVSRRHDDAAPSLGAASSLASHTRPSGNRHSRVGGSYSSASHNTGDGGQRGGGVNVRGNAGSGRHRGGSVGVAGNTGSGRRRVGVGGVNTGNGRRRVGAGGGNTGSGRRRAGGGGGVGGGDNIPPTDTITPPYTSSFLDRQQKSAETLRQRYKDADEKKKKEEEAAKNPQNFCNLRHEDPMNKKFQKRRRDDEDDDTTPGGAAGTRGGGFGVSAR